jgi:hypothetical protein
MCKAPSVLPCKSAHLWGGAEGIRTPDLRRANATRRIRERPFTFEMCCKFAHFGGLHGIVGSPDPVGYRPGWCRVGVKIGAPAREGAPGARGGLGPVLDVTSFVVAAEAGQGLAGGAGVGVPLGVVGEVLYGEQAGASPLLRKGWISELRPGSGAWQMHESRARHTVAREDGWFLLL